MLQGKIDGISLSGTKLVDLIERWSVFRNEVFPGQPLELSSRGESLEQFIRNGRTIMKIESVEHMRG